MMSCTRLYVEPTESLMVQAREKRPVRLMIVNFISTLKCGNICHQKAENGFNGYLNFPIRSHSFLPVRGPSVHFSSKKKKCILGGVFALEGL